MRTLDLGSYRSAWFMAHRIREALDGANDNGGPLGGPGKVVEADEAYWGRVGKEADEWVFVNDFGWVQKKQIPEKMKIVTLVERGGRSGSVKVEAINKGT